MIAVKGAGDDPWALAGEAALTSVAAKSADDLAAFLSNTPEAAAHAAAPAPAAETPLSYAPLNKRVPRTAHSVDSRGARRPSSSERRIVPGRLGCYDPPRSPRRRREIGRRTAFARLEPPYAR